MLCTVIRDRKGVNFFNPVYYFQLSFNNKILMKASKIPGIKSKYIISINNNNNVEDNYNNAIGVLSSDFMGTLFNLFDKSKASKEKHVRDNSNILTTINYVYLSFIYHLGNESLRYK
jgi:hypothetical protein